MFGPLAPIDAEPPVPSRAREEAGMQSDEATEGRRDIGTGGRRDMGTKGSACAGQAPRRCDSDVLRDLGMRRSGTELGFSLASVGSVWVRFFARTGLTIAPVGIGGFVRDTFFSRIAFFLPSDVLVLCAQVHGKNVRGAR